MALIDNLIAYWKMDEASGNIADATGNGHTGTGVNTPTFVAGKINNAGHFIAASTQYFSLVDGAALKQTGNWTMTAWVKTSTAATMIVQNHGSFVSNISGITLRILTGKTYVSSARNSGGGAPSAGTDYQELVGVTSVGDGAYHFLVAQYDGTNLTLFVDGTQDNQIAWTNGAVYLATEFHRIGDGYQAFGGGETQYFDGDIDEMGFWSRALTGAEITSLYNAGVGKQYPFGTNYTATFNEVITIVETFSKSLSRSFVEVITIVETFSKAIAKSFNETISIVETFITAKIREAIYRIGKILRLSGNIDKPTGGVEDKDKPTGMINDKDKPRGV